jgi:tetratricopeptide (TPR) repeat protein
LSRIAAASFVVLLIITSISLYLLRPDGNMSNDSLFKIYYQPDAALLIRGTDSQNATLIQAFQLYENKDYESALGLFSQVMQKDEENIPVKFYSGISYIELGQYRTALEPFNFIMEHKQNLYLERAEWFAGLCYLKLNENDNAIELFNKISLSNSFYKDKAIAILKQIPN